MHTQTHTHIRSLTPQASQIVFTYDSSCQKPMLYTNKPHTNTAPIYTPTNTQYYTDTKQEHTYCRTLTAGPEKDEHGLVASIQLQIGPQGGHILSVHVSESHPCICHVVNDSLTDCCEERAVLEEHWICGFVANLNAACAEFAAMLVRSREVGLVLCLSVCLTVCLSVSLLACLFVYLFCVPLRENCLSARASASFCVHARMLLPR